MSKENLQRVSGDLPCDEFYLTINSISKDLEVTFAEAGGLLKKFKELNIITNIDTPSKGSKYPSFCHTIFSNFTNNDKSNDKSNESSNEKLSDTNALWSIDNNDFTVSKTMPLTTLK